MRIDFDGDEKTDVAVWRPSNGVWYIKKSSDGGILSPQWGLGSLGDESVPGDYDGDRKTDVAVWRPSTGVWYIQKSSDGGMLSPQWGLGSLGDVPVPGDYDGDGKTDFAVWRPDSGIWFIQKSTDGGMLSPQWGLGSLGDAPVPGDYDGDGKTDVAVWRPDSGIWFIQKSSNGGMLSPQWGLGSLGDESVPGDYDGDGKTDVAVWRSSSGVWYIQKSSDGGMLSPQWGLGSLGDVPVPGDYDGDRKTDVAVWRPSTGVWYIQRSSDGGMMPPQWGSGALNDVPIASGTSGISVPVGSPMVVTHSAGGITTTGSTLHGEANPNGSATSAWFEWGTDPDLNSLSTTPTQDIGSGFATLPLSAAITALDSWTTYYFRAAAENSAGITRGVIKSFTTGDYYVAVGDSITGGSHDDIPGDDTSLDGRNTGGGYEPILNDLLTAEKGYPHTVINQGVSGDTSADGVAVISSTLSNHLSARYFLVMYGTNDAKVVPAVTKSTYKNNMQTILSAIIAAGKTPYLAKVPFTTDVRFDIGSILEYNVAIDELIFENGIAVTPPDFYTLFQDTSLLDEGLHPNGTGYQAMASQWQAALP